MRTYSADRIHNVGLFSHAGAGKTTLAEAMLYETGAVNRMGRVDEGTTVSDYEPEEIDHKVSIHMSLLPIEWNDSKINIIDAPGYAEFQAEAFAEQGLVVIDVVDLDILQAEGVDDQLFDVTVQIAHLRRAP